MAKSNPVVEVVGGKLAKNLCSCCTPPSELFIGKGSIPFALCRKADKIYEAREDETYALTGYVFDHGNNRILDPATNAVIFPKEPPKSDELLNQLRPKVASDESAGGKQPRPENSKVDLGRAEYW